MDAPGLRSHGRALRDGRNAGLQRQDWLGLEADRGIGQRFGEAAACGDQRRTG